MWARTFAALGINYKVWGVRHLMSEERTTMRHAAPLATCADAEFCVSLIQDATMRLDLLDRESKYSNGQRLARGLQQRTACLNVIVLSFTVVDGKPFSAACRLLPLAAARVAAAGRHLGAQPGQLHLLGFPGRSRQRQDGGRLPQS